MRDLLDLDHDDGIQWQQVVPVQQGLRCLRSSNDLAKVVVAELGKHQILFRTMPPGRKQANDRKRR
jgi:hypothetical protein